MKFVIFALAVVTILQSVLAQNTHREYKTPNGGGYYGTINSNGVTGGYGGGYSSGGDGFVGGYGGSGPSGSYGGPISGSAGGGIPFPAFDPFINPGEFERLITGHFEQLQKQQASGVSMVHATPGGTASAWTSLTNNDNLFRQNLENQSKLFGVIRNQVQSAQGGSNYASASSSYGPNGIHQTAAVHPENQAAPNIDTRFAGDGGNDGGKFYGVSSASFFESENVNGVENQRKGAVTTVNDNGKITTYKAGF